MSMTMNDEFDPAWDVMRDKNGDPITVTWAQVRAIWHAFTVWERVVAKEQADLPSEQRQTEMSNAANWQKSRLLGRMLIEGRPPTRTRPPVVMSEPRWDLLPGGDPFAPPAPTEAER